MPRFRARSSSVFSSTWEVRQAIADALRPAHFFEGRTIRLEWAEVEREEIAWEIFQGRLLDLAHTRCRQSFETWNIFRIGPEGRSSEPLLSVKLDAGNGLVHVTRAIFCYAQEGYHAGDNVYLSRETQKWVRELAGTIPLARMEDGETFRDELTGRLFQAVVGSSRLPLTSVEAPLPGFTLGELGYFYRSEVPAPREPMRSFHDLIEGGWEADLSWLEQVKLLELVLRATPAEHLEEATALWVKERRLAAETISQLLRGLFDEVALSPYTDFVARTMSFLTMLERAGGWSVEAHTDFLSHLLRQLGRHLTAYDLVTFHHRGANYPDILLLDTALKEYLALIERRPALFDAAAAGGRLRRRALRQAWLLRRHYEGHPVPDAPTSPGENVRILPPPFARVPDEQIADPGQRTKRLFAADPLPASLPGMVGEVLRQSLRDLEHPQELQELGMATFLDRPLGVFKQPGEPDQTLLLSYETFSRRVAGRRLGELPDPAERALGQQRLGGLPVQGISVELPVQWARPGSVALTDAFKVADDFVVLRTTCRSVREFLALFDFTPLRERFTLDYLDEGRRVIIVRTEAVGGLRLFDDAYRCRLELQMNPQAGYESRGGLEYPASGLQVVRVWEPAEDGLREHRVGNVVLRPV